LGHFGFAALAVGVGVAASAGAAIVSATAMRNLIRILRLPSLDQLHDIANVPMGALVQFELRL